MSELKPCPFCGKEQSEENFFSCDGYPQACGCWETTHSGEEAVNVWNTRPIEDELRAEIARRDEIIGKLKRGIEDIISTADFSVVAFVPVLPMTLDEVVTELKALMKELE